MDINESKPKEMFKDLSDVEKLTFDQAMQVVEAARYKLWEELGSEYMRFTDDEGDDLEAATSNWAELHNVVYSANGVKSKIIEGVKKFLRVPISGDTKGGSGWGGSDGEVRYDLFSDEYCDE